MMKPLRVYVDTSVIGGCFDVEFAAESQALIEMARNGQAVLIVSDLLAEEIQAAPPPVRELYASLPSTVLEIFVTNDEAERLRDAYLGAGVVGPAADHDAQHVANATVARADMIVSWNFRHIVHFDKIRAYNVVNLQEGYGLLAIPPPTEVI